MATTIKDIALAVGVAHSTVARALADHPHISIETKALVRDAAERLGYVVDSAARTMRGGRSTLIGLIVPAIENDFYAQMAKALADCCRREGFQLLLSITEDDPDAEHHELRALKSARPAGVVIVPTSTPRRESTALLEGIPSVQLIRHIPAFGQDSVTVDDTAALHDATKHLIDLGHRRIAFLGGGEKLSTGASRFAGYRKALSEARIKYDERLVWRGMPRASAAVAAFKDILAQGKPTAVVTAGALIAQGALEAMDELQLSAPKDLSIVGFGDPPWARWWGKGLTTVSLPVREVAMTSATYLIRRIRDGASAGTPEPYNAVLKSRLIARKSTAAPA